MCGRFAQYQSLADYLRELDSEEEVIGGWEDTPLERYNVAPSTQVHLLRSTAGGIVAAPVRWGWRPQWAVAKKIRPMINARSEGVAESRFFREIWPHRGLLAADGWYEWPPVSPGSKETQPYFIHLQDGSPCFFAAIGQFPDGDDPQEHDGFVIITADALGGMVDVHDRRPVVLTPDLAREWIDPATTPLRAEQILLHQGRPAENFAWHKVDKAVGNYRNQGPQLIEPIN